MSVRQRKDGYWIVDFRDEQGRKRTRSFGKGRESKQKAVEFDLEVKLNKTRGEPLPQTRAAGIYLDELAQHWIDEKKAQGRKSQWLADWAKIFNKYFLPTLCERPAHSLTQPEILAVVSTHFGERSQTTRNRYIGYIKSIFQYGVEQNHLQANPLARWKKGKEPRRRSQLTLQDFRALCRHAPPHLAWMLKVAWHVPARPGGSDLFALTFLRNVYYERGGIEFFHSKVSKWAFIQCSAEFMDEVKAKEGQHASGHLIEYRGKPILRADTSVKTAARKAGLSFDVCLYDVRHLWITTMLDRGLEPSAIAYMAGTSIEMIHANYYEPHAAEKKRALKLLPKIETGKADDK